MPEVIAIVVDWMGPFGTLKEARSLAKKEGIGDALYLATGKRKYQRQRGLQYVGISTKIENRLHNGRFTGISSDLSLWIGMIASHAVAGKRRIKRSTTVDLAEWGLAYFLQLPLNKNKRKRPPPYPILLSNRWFHGDFTPRTKRPLKDWPDIIEYDGTKSGARIAWLTHPHRNRRLSEKDVRNLQLNI